MDNQPMLSPTPIASSCLCNLSQQAVTTPVSSVAAFAKLILGRERVERFCGESVLETQHQRKIISSRTVWSPWGDVLLKTYTFIWNVIYIYTSKVRCPNFQFPKVGSLPNIPYFQRAPLISTQIRAQGTSLLQISKQLRRMSESSCVFLNS